MSVRKTVKTAIINGRQVTPSGDGSFPSDIFNWEAMRNLDESLDFKYIPNVEPVTLPIVLNESVRSHIRTTKQTTGWDATFFFRDGSTLQLSGAAITNNPAVDGDGVSELEMVGNPRWL